MTYRTPPLAPASQLSQAQRGSVGGRFCRGCGSIYARYAARHKGKPMYGKDHVSAPCNHEGEMFEDGASWWEAAVTVIPEVPAEADEPADEQSA